MRRHIHVLLNLYKSCLTVNSCHLFLFAMAMGYSLSITVADGLPMQMYF